MSYFSSIVMQNQINQLLKHPINPWLSLGLCFSAFIGITKIIKYSWLTLNFLYRNLLRRSYNHINRYGDTDSWVVITGGSDGIGLSYAKEQAGKGFNICIIGRSEGKMRQKLAEIKDECNKDIKTMYVIADFSTITTFDEYQKVADQLADIDIAMLFLNAGVVNRGPFKDLYPQEIEAMVNVNVLHVIYLLKALLPQLLKRTKRSAIVTTGSNLDSKPFPGVITYSASKTFVSFLAQGLNYELRDKIDVTNYQCGMVRTNLNQTMPLSFWMITPERAAKGSLSEVGHEAVTNGPFNHEAGLWRNNYTRESVIYKMFYDLGSMILQQKRESEKLSKPSGNN